MSLRNRLASSLLVASLVLSLVPAVGGAEVAQLPTAELVPNGPELVNVLGAGLDELVGSHHFVLELHDAPGALAHFEAASRGRSKAEVAQATRAQLAKIEKAQRDVLRAMESNKISGRVVYTVKNTLNGIVVYADAQELGKLQRLPGVKSVELLPLHERSDTYSIPFIGSAQTWANYGTLGENIKVAVIDSGIDYIHTMFGGPGTAAAYAAPHTTTNQYFPSAKVVGGWDFAGNSYTGSNTPQPDPNPRDCASTSGGGHGTHVAGTIGGYGVNADGTTYTGPYDSTTPFSSLRIGPGVAPLAQLYGLRVFGCTGSTGLTVQALDWTVDPNGDGDYSDRMDVANLSLGSSYGAADDASARAANNASLAGVMVVISAGNSGDVYYISGSPGSATRALTVASSVDASEVVDNFRVNDPASIAGMYGGSVSSSFNWSNMATPVTGQVTYDPTNPAGCNAYPAGSLTGRIVLQDWVPAGLTTFPCGSAVRANNAAAAGAVGVIMAENQPFLSTAIAGNATIPAILTNNVAGDAIKSELASGVSVTFNRDWLQGGRIVAETRNDTLSTFTSRGPRKGNALKPDISAPGQSIYSADSGTGTRGSSKNGTSMAAPHMAGVMALLKERNPQWSVEELKALAMNTAGNDLWTDLGQTGSRFNQARVGAGRVDTFAASANKVVAYSAENPGAVSVSFGAVEVLGSTTLTQTVRVVNKGTTPATYQPTVDMYSTIPGVQYVFPDGLVHVPAGGSATFRVQLIADAGPMRATRDASVAAVQNGNPRQWIPEHSGLIKLVPVNPAPGASATLRIPVYATARPAANVSTVEKSLSFPGTTGSGLLTLTGTGLATGGSSNIDYNAIVTPFELQHVGNVASLNLTSIHPSAINASVQYAGITTDSRARVAAGQALNTSRLFFGIAAHSDWSAPASEVTYTIQTTTNLSGTSGTHQVWNTRNSVTSGGSTTDYDVMLSCGGVIGATSSCAFTNGFNSNLQTAVFNNNVMILPVNVTQLGLTSTTTRFKWRIVASSRFFGTVETTPWYTYDYAKPGLDFTNGSISQPTFFATPGTTLGVNYNQADYTAAASKGILLLQNFNASGNRAQVVSVNTTPVSLAFTNAPTSRTYGSGTFPVTVNSNAAVIGSVTQDVCTVGATSNGTATVTIRNAGTCRLRAQFAGTSTTAPGSVDAVITIEKANLTITPAAVTRQFGDANPALTGTIVGLAAGDNITAKYSTTAGATAAVGTYPISADLVDNQGRLPNYNLTVNAGTLTVAPKVTSTSVAPVSGQYSDAVTLRATVSPALHGGDQVTGSVAFTVGGVAVGSASVDAAGVATLTVANDRIPGNAPVTAAFTSTNPNFTGSNGAGTLNVTAEDAVVTYTGSLFVATSCPTCGTATVTLSATLQDAADGQNGDIRTATARFINLDTNTEICSGPVGLVTAGDTTTGTATCSTSVSLGNADALTLNVGVVVGGRYSGSDAALVTVIKPVPGSINGGGFLNLVRSAGLYAGEGKLNFAFNVKYNRNQTNTQGNVNVIVRKDGRLYQIKSTAINSLTVSEADGTATLTGKAVINDITNPAKVISIDGNASIQLTLTDRGEPGSADSLGITVHNRAGGLWFSSNWDGTRTVEQTLNGGNIQVR